MNQHLERHWSEDNVSLILLPTSGSRSGHRTTCTGEQAVKDTMGLCHGARRQIHSCQRKPTAEHTILGLRLESIIRDIRTTPVSHRYLCTLTLDTQFRALESAQGTSTWFLRQCMALSRGGRLGSSVTSALLATGLFLPLVS